MMKPTLVSENYNIYLKYYQTDCLECRFNLHALNVFGSHLSRFPYHFSPVVDVNE